MSAGRRSASGPSRLCVASGFSRKAVADVKSIELTRLPAEAGSHATAFSEPANPRTANPRIYPATRRAFRDELVVHQVRVAGEHSIDLCHLAGTQLLVRIEAPPAGEQALAAQHFVDAGNASGEIVRRIEQRRIQIGELGAKREQTLNLSGRRRADRRRQPDTAPAIRRRVSSRPPTGRAARRGTATPSPDPLTETASPDPPRWHRRCPCRARRRCGRSPRRRERRRACDSD